MLLCVINCLIIDYPNVYDATVFRELLQGCSLFKLYNIPDLETSQSVLRSYVQQYVNTEAMNAPTPLTARSQQSAPSTGMHSNTKHRNRVNSAVTPNNQRNRGDYYDSDECVDDFNADIDLPDRKSRFGKGSYENSLTESVGNMSISMQSSNGYGDGNEYKEANAKMRSEYSNNSEYDHDEFEAPDDRYDSDDGKRGDLNHRHRK